MCLRLQQTIEKLFPKELSAREEVAKAATLRIKAAALSRCEATARECSGVGGGSWLANISSPPS